jgi:hypothetical protein
MLPGSITTAGPYDVMQKSGINETRAELSDPTLFIIFSVKQKARNLFTLYSLLFTLYSLLFTLSSLLSALRFPSTQHHRPRYALLTRSELN